MLTKEQLLAMPESEYMNEAQLAFFKQLLEQQRDEILENIDSIKKSLASTERSADLNDVASSQEMQQFDLRTVDRLNKLLKKVESSLERIDEGEYGYCEMTGEPIGLERLLARPTATLSVQAKEIQEHQEKTQGGS